MIILLRQSGEARGSAPDAPPIAHVLADLSAQTRQLGFELAKAGAPYVTPDERKLLGWIAYLQRGRSYVTVHVDARVLPVVLACALALTDAGMPIPYRAALTTSLVEDARPTEEQETFSVSLMKRRRSRRPK